MVENIISDVMVDSIKLYALMTPPAVLSAFLGASKDYTAKQKHSIAFKTSLAIFIIGMALYVFGADLFELFGFTLDAFRIGSGVLLMLVAISLMKDDSNKPQTETDGDISIVPLAIPLGLGPASIGAIMVMGASATTHQKLAIGVISLFVAAFCMYLLLMLGDLMGKILRNTGIAVLSKLTGLLLAALAAQVIFTGVVGFLNE